ncbi:thyroid transcription factor 1-associated protein 26-like [Silurus meridionalis]|nr:thyroid transcription factor 1-associated protein 26-like [Silurus meridionalis]
MAPVNPHLKGKASFKGKNTKINNADRHPSAAHKKKKTWNPGNKFFQGSLQEGKGFAFQRKQKVQQEYKKILRKEKWRLKDSKPKLEEEYPEHLKHLYLAEQEKLIKEEQLNRARRRKGRNVDAEEEEEEESVLSNSVTSPENSAASFNKEPQTSQIESSVQDQLRKNKWKKMSSNQKMIEEYKRKNEERERKREEYLKDKAQREEALKKYKEKKMATYQLLKKKTKKGQPNLNLQMELLLQKIQAQRK